MEQGLKIWTKGDSVMVVGTQEERAGGIQNEDRETPNWQFRSNKGKERYEANVGEICRS
jgi:hypothetical protein